MIYPFIYTRTKYHDYRLITSQSLQVIHGEFVEKSLILVRTAIDAKNEQLKQPSWVLIKTNDYILWGISCLNETIATQSYDKVGRQVRGFFGIVADASLDQLPFGLSFYKKLYQTYVSPVWDSVSIMDEITGLVTIPLGSDLVVKTQTSVEVNESSVLCRLFPAVSNPKPYIESVFSSGGYNSIVTNIHSRSQFLLEGIQSFPILNMIMDIDSNQFEIENVQTGDLVNNADDLRPESDNDFATSDKSELSSNDTMLSDSYYPKTKRVSVQRICFHVFMLIICALLFIKGVDIWEIILPIVGNKETGSQVQNSMGYAEGRIEQPYFELSKPCLMIHDAKLGGVFQVSYKSNAPIYVIKTPKWLNISIEKELIIIECVDSVKQQIKKDNIVFSNGSITINLPVMLESQSVNQ